MLVSARKIDRDSIGSAVQRHSGELLWLRPLATLHPPEPCKDFRHSPRHNDGAKHS